MRRRRWCCCCVHIRAFALSWPVRFRFAIAWQVSIGYQVFPMLSLDLEFNMWATFSWMVSISFHSRLTCAVVGELRPIPRGLLLSSSISFSGCCSGSWPKRCDETNWDLKRKRLSHEQPRYIMSNIIVETNKFVLQLLLFWVPTPGCCCAVGRARIWCQREV